MRKKRVKSWIAEIVATYPVGKIFTSKEVMESFANSRWKHFTPQAVTIGMELPRLDHVIRIDVGSSYKYKRVWTEGLDEEE